MDKQDVYETVLVYAFHWRTWIAAYCTKHSLCRNAGLANQLDKSLVQVWTAFLIDCYCFLNVL